MDQGGFGVQVSILSPRLIRKGLVAALSVSLLTIMFLLVRTTSAKTWLSLLTFKPAGLLLVAALVFGSWLIEGLRVQLIGRALGEKLPLRTILGINLATLFSGNITPFTSGGAPTQVYFLHRSGFSLGKATAVVTIRMALSTLFFTIGGPILIFLFQGEILRQFKLYAWAVPIRILLLFTLALSVAILWFLIRPSQGTTFANWFFNLGLIKRLLKEKADRYRQRFLQEMSEFHDSLMLLTQKKRIQIVGILLYTLLYWVVFFCIAPAILVGFGVQVWPQIFRLIFLQFVFIYLLSFIPIPGGSGIAEVGYYSVFAFFVPKHILAVFVALWRILSYHLTTLVGGLFFLKLIHTKQPEADLPG
jgi:uncharacterized protein (TIRG00374 family)